MANVSLESSIRTCAINTGKAPNIYSERFLDSRNLVCPAFTGVDTTGRPVCENSFKTKYAGCNSPLDRVDIENFQRPQYVELINLNQAGIKGNMYGNLPSPTSMTQWDMMKKNDDIGNIYNLTGNFGLQFPSNIRSTCGLNNYERAMAQQAENQRTYAQIQNEMISNQYKQYANINGMQTSIPGPHLYEKVPERTSTAPYKIYNDVVYQNTLPSLNQMVTMDQLNKNNQYKYTSCCS